MSHRLHSELNFIAAPARGRPVPLSAMGAAWCHHIRVSFGECDPAGIVFAPRYFEFFARTLDAFYGQRMGLDQRALIGTRRIGLVYAKLSCEYFRPLSYGDDIEIYVLINRISTSSYGFMLHLFHGGTEATRGCSLHVVTSLETFKKMPIPEDIRSALEDYRRASP